MKKEVYQILRKTIPEVELVSLWIVKIGMIQITI